MEPTIKNMAYWKAKNGNSHMKQVDPYRRPTLSNEDLPEGMQGGDYMFDDKGFIVPSPEGRKKRNEEYMQSRIRDPRLASPEEKPQRDPESRLKI